MQNGLRPEIVKDHRNRDLHKSFGSAAPAQFPLELLNDAGLWVPDQNQESFVPFNIPAMPYGCTDYAQADLASDLSGALHNPEDLENMTHANAKGGIDIKTALLAAKALGWFRGFYQITASGILDYFDSFRLALLSAQPERRTMTWGTPWFPSWENACNPNANPSGVMPMPTEAELFAVRQNPNAFPWHNSKLDGWTTNGMPVMRDKSWQGNTIGVGGFIFFPREVINTVMALKGTVAYTATNLTPTSVQTIDVNLVQWIVSYVRQLLGLQ